MINFNQNTIDRAKGYFLRNVIARRIQLLIVISGYTQEQLAQRVQVTQPTVSSWILAKSDIRLIDYIQVIRVCTRNDPFLACDELQIRKMFWQFENNYLLEEITARKIK